MFSDSNWLLRVSYEKMIVLPLSSVGADFLMPAQIAAVIRFMKGIFCREARGLPQSRFAPQNREQQQEQTTTTLKNALEIQRTCLAKILLIVFRKFVSDG